MARMRWRSGDEVDWGCCAGMRLLCSLEVHANRLVSVSGSRAPSLLSSLYLLTHSYCQKLIYSSSLLCTAHNVVRGHYHHFTVGRPGHSLCLCVVYTVRLDGCSVIKNLLEGVCRRPACSTLVSGLLDIFFFSRNTPISTVGTRTRELVHFPNPSPPKQTKCSRPAC